MNLATKFSVKPISLRLRGIMHKPMHVVAPLWKKRVLKTQAWYVKKYRIIER